MAKVRLTIAVEVDGGDVAMDISDFIESHCKGGSGAGDPNDFATNLSEASFVEFDIGRPEGR